MFRETPFIHRTIKQHATNTSRHTCSYAKLSKSRMNSNRVSNFNLRKEKEKITGVDDAKCQNLKRNAEKNEESAEM